MAQPDLPKYVGCFRDDANRDLVYGPKSWGYDVPACQAACDGYAFMSIQAGKWCFCDNDYSTPSTSYYQLNDSECLANPPGICGDTQYCGGDWANAVYSLALTNQSTQVTPTPPPPAPSR